MEQAPRKGAIVDIIIKGYMLNMKVSQEAVSCRYLLSVLHQLDKNEANEQTRGTNLPAEVYEYVMNWTMELVENLNCHKTTKYLVRCYLAEYISRQSQISCSQLQPLAVTCILIAIKFNESFDYSLYLALYHCPEGYTRLMLLQLEQHVLETLQFRLSRVTPFCYLGILETHQPDILPESLDRLHLLLEYSCLLSALSGRKARVVLAGCLLNCLDQARSGKMLQMLIRGRRSYLLYAQCVRKLIERQLEIDTDEIEQQNVSI